MQQEKINIMLHSFVIDVLTKGRTVKGVVAVSKSGKHVFNARVVIDCTGDGDVATAAGASYWFGREADHLAQPLTLMFRMGGIDLKKIIDYIQRYPEDFRLDKAIEPQHLSIASLYAVCGFFEIVKQARQEGILSFPCDRVLAFRTPRDGEMIINMTRVQGVDCTKVDELSLAEMEARRQVFEVVAFLQQKVPGFSNSYLIETGTYTGARESRHIRGKYVLTVDDIVGARKFEDGIACGAFPVDIHNPVGEGGTYKFLPDGEFYTIPYRVLLPDGLDGLLIAGRCVSATHEAAGSIRVSPTAMALGQAAGVAAALAVKHGCSVHEVQVDKLRDKLKAQGTFIP